MLRGKNIKKRRGYRYIDLKKRGACRFAEVLFVYLSMVK